MNTGTIDEAMHELLHGPDVPPEQQRVHRITTTQPARNLARFLVSCDCGWECSTPLNESDARAETATHLRAFDACVDCGTVSGPHGESCTLRGTMHVQPEQCPQCGRGAPVERVKHPLVQAADAFLEKLEAEGLLS